MHENEIREMIAYYREQGAPQDQQMLMFFSGITFPPHSLR